MLFQTLERSHLHSDREEKQRLSLQVHTCGTNMAAWLLVAMASCYAKIILTYNFLGKFGRKYIILVEMIVLLYSSVDFYN